MRIQKARIVRGLAEQRNSLAIAPDRRLAGFSIQIRTGTVDHGGTDANVYFVVNGSAFLLDKPSYDDFERGDTDLYSFTLGMTMQDFRRATLQIGHDNRGRNAGWYCDWIQLFVRPEDRFFATPYRRWPPIGWLAKDENMGELWATLQDGQQQVQLLEQPEVQAWQKRFREQRDRAVGLERTVQAIRE